MKIKPGALTSALSQGDHRVYLVESDDFLLRQEAADTIRAHCREQGFTEHTLLIADNQLDWNRLREAASALSLFGDRTLVDLRFLKPTVNADARQALQDFLDTDNPDTCLLVSGPRLRDTGKQKWYKTANQQGLLLTLYPLDPKDLPHWLKQRFRAAGLKATPAALELIAERVEGNLLAARQEVDKLALLAEDDTVDVPQVLEAVADSARYDVFRLNDLILSGRTREALRVLRGLRAEGIDPPTVIWAMARDCRLLLNVGRLARQQPVAQAVKQQRVFWKRENLVAQAVGRIRRPRLWQALQRLHVCDKAVKGQDPRDPWILLEDTVMHLAPA